MTVCVAAICNGNMVFGASDRMLTAGDIQFEPEQPKIVPLTSSIIAMLAGDSALQEEIIQILRVNIHRRLNTNPPEPVGVGTAATLCSLAYRKARARRTERDILAPLGLDNNTFISRQREMEPQLLQRIAGDLVNYEMPRVETIITGVDPAGAHIFIVNDGEVHCLDTVGFASIGVGRWHSNSQFMFSGHMRGRPLAETLLLAYAAKRRAEVAPGVGEGTDMFSVGPEPGSFYQLESDILTNLKGIYDRTKEKNEAAIREANLEVNNYVAQLVAAATAASEQARKAEETIAREQAAMQAEAEPPPPEAIEPEPPSPEG